MGKLDLYTKEDFEKLMQTNFSIRDMLIAVGLLPRGLNYKTLKKHLQLHGLYDIFEQRKRTIKINLKDHFIITKEIMESRLADGNFIMGSSKLKPLLTKFGFKQDFCERCGTSEWIGVKLSLQLHHKDGNCYNNKLDNLEILCPNCHSLTPTFAGKGARKTANKKIKLCIDCGKMVSPTALRCHTCSTKNCHRSYRTYPELVILIKEVNEYGYSAVGRKYDVSDTAIKKHLIKLLGVSYKSIMTDFESVEGGALPSTPV